MAPKRYYTLRCTVIKGAPFYFALGKKSCTPSTLNLAMRCCPALEVSQSIKSIAAR